MSENPVMTFPIKKRIYAELFIYGKQGYFIKKVKVKKLSDLLEECKLKGAEIGTKNNK